MPSGALELLSNNKTRAPSALLPDGYVLTETGYARQSAA